MSLLQKIALSLALAAPIASQATLSAPSTGGTTFDFYNPTLFNLLDTKSGSHSVTVNGIGLTITPVSSSSSAQVAINGKGIGVSTGLLEPGELNSGLLGAPGDALLLSFNQTVKLNTLDLSLWENGLILPLDKAAITTGGNTYALSNSWNNGGLSLNTFSLGGTNIPQGKFFVLSAEGSLSSFRLAGLNVSSVSAVPESTSAAMFLVGLLGLGLVKGMRSRRQVG